MLIGQGAQGWVLPHLHPDMGWRRRGLVTQGKSRCCHQKRGMDVGQMEKTDEYLGQLCHPQAPRFRDDNAFEAGIL